MMTSLQHRPGGRGIAVLAFVAAVLLAASPLLMEHHHHVHPQDSDHCALCIFASCQVTSPAVPPTPARPLTVVAIVSAIQETLPASPLIHCRNQRAPPVV